MRFWHKNTIVITNLIERVRKKRRVSLPKHCGELERNGKYARTQLRRFINKIQEETRKMKGRQLIGDKIPELRISRSHEIQGDHKVPNRITLRRLILSDNEISDP